jgi:hypothetical protein
VFCHLGQFTNIEIIVNSEHINAHQSLKILDITQDAEAANFLGYLNISAIGVRALSDVQHYCCTLFFLLIVAPIDHPADFEGINFNAVNYWNDPLVLRNLTAISKYLRLSASSLIIFT